MSQLLISNHFILIYNFTANMLCSVYKSKIRFKRHCERPKFDIRKWQLVTFIVFDFAHAHLTSEDEQYEVEECIELCRINRIFNGENIVYKCEFNLNLQRAAPAWTCKQYNWMETAFDGQHIQYWIQSAIFIDSTEHRVDVTINSIS